VFEPNDERLWQSLRNTIGAFMDVQFRNGMFAGKTSDKAYFVKVDAETTTPDDQAAGIVNILVGFAPLRPAEFVVVSLQQMAGRSQ
jgi:phage tail sheath protein FI